MIPVRYNIRSLGVRKTTTFATAFGIGLVVFVLSSALMLSAGVKKTLAISGSPDVAIVLRNGSDNELSSTIDMGDVNRIVGAPGVKHDGQGRPIGAGEIIVVAAMEKLGTAGVANVQIRGVGDDVMAFRPEAKIIEGRPPKPGGEEVIVGERIRGRFKGTDLGQSFELRKNRPVTVVGVFSAGGSSYESEIWANVDAVRSAYAREGIVSSVRVRLDSAGAYDGFRAAMEGDKRFGYQTMREREYFEKQSEGTSLFIGAMGTIVAVFFALGAMIGAMITMYAAVANRSREIGTLRAIGFTRTSILISFLLESIALSLLGGVVGAIASLAMGFVHFSMMNFSSWSEIVFKFEPTPTIILTSLIFAGGMGVIGGFFPALAAARISPTQAMRG